MIVVELAGEYCGVSGAPALEDAIAARYAAFVSREAPTMMLDVAITDAFLADYAAPTALSIAMSSGVITVAGSANGTFARDAGTLRDVTDLGAVDAMLRAIVSVRAPARGVLLMHGMIAPSAAGATVLLGSSGAGKSTAARALGAACDEIVALDATHAASTPYWGSTRYRAPRVALGVLSRGDGSVSRRRGAAAMRALAPHVVRYVNVVDRTVLALLAQIVERGVWNIAAPVGESFPRFITTIARDLACAEAT